MIVYALFFGRAWWQAFELVADYQTPGSELAAGNLNGAYSFVDSNIRPGLFLPWVLRNSSFSPGPPLVLSHTCSSPGPLLVLRISDDRPDFFLPCSLALL